ncbi:MAG: tRNA guanosine(34) transglycosylase Tgt [Candidatus Microgenomates bacterium]
MFKVFYQSKKKGSRARIGEIITSHGVIKTPAFVAVGTKGTVKSIFPPLLKEIGTQVAFVNNYHLVTHPGADIIERSEGIHKWANLNIPLMSDSGGFQVFSLARKRDSGSKFLSHESLTPTESSGSPRKRKNFSPSSYNNDYFNDKTLSLVKISDDGVKFRSTFDGSVIEFTPEKSIEYQRQIGADINMAFDECIPYGVSYEYTKAATERTHRWLERCIKEIKNQKSKIKNSNQKSKIEKNQYLYGVIQGGMFEDLRKKSAEFVVSQNTPGVAIGGVSVGESKKEMRDQVKWVADYLPKDRPVHLLGVGQIDDILDLVVYGIDTFDCVEPTRLARMGTIYQIGSAPFSRKQKNGESLLEKAPSPDFSKVDILRGVYKDDFSAIDEDCDCYVCQNFIKSYLHHLFKNRELLAYTLATYHNLYVMEKIFAWIREMIEKDLI